MHHITFDRFTRRAAGLLDRRSLFGRAGGALLAAAGIPLQVAAKKHKHKNKNQKSCKNRAEKCRQEFQENCSDFDVDDTEGCLDAINACCKKGAKCKIKDIDKLFDTCADVLCEFKSSC
jgi:hypothetical protein